MNLTDYHAKYFAHELTKRCSSDSIEKLAGAVASAQVDLNPHQVDAALFAFNSPLSKGALLADEVGLGKTIEAGLVLSQKWAERKRRILVITPSNLRKQWHQELTEKFFLPCQILETKSYNAAIKQGIFRPFETRDTIVICSYQFARNKAGDVNSTPWDLVVMDEAHRLRNVYKPANVIANTLKLALAGKNKLLLTATPLQNSLLELFGLVSFVDEHAFGDLKSFREQFSGKIKCISIDPPYNTGSAFEHYDDGIEHSLWLSLMRERLEILNRLLSDDGSLWITIDDNEAHYLKVLCDEVIGRPQFVANIVWQKRTSRENRAAIGSAHDHVLLYAKRGAIGWKDSRNPLPPNDSGYSNPDKDPRGPWRSIPFSAQGFRKNQMYKIKTPLGGEVDPPKGRCWAATEPEYSKLVAEKRVYFPNDGTGKPRIKQFKGEEKGLVPMTWWDAELAGDNEEAKKEILNLFPDDEAFGTPKPERLLQHIVQIASNPGDWVLDSFGGSGTTGAVAHKMGRRWIMVELEETCHTHIIPRLKKVVDGADSGGITEAVGWKGGGGFRYYRLAPSLLEKDKWGNFVINKQFNPAMLAEAVCKLEGFVYAPSDAVYWQHGHSTERDFIYVTTQNLSSAQLQQLSDEVGAERSLLALCAAFRGKAERWPNLTVKKIPKTVLSRCEWGHDDYSLQVENLPKAPPKRGQQEMELV